MIKCSDDIEKLENLLSLIGFNYNRYNTKFYFNYYLNIKSFIFYIFGIKNVNHLKNGYYNYETDNNKYSINLINEYINDIPTTLKFLIFDKNDYYTKGYVFNINDIDRLMTIIKDISCFKTITRKEKIKMLLNE